MEIKITLENASLEAAQLQGEQTNKVIEGFFNVLGAAPTKNDAPTIKVVTSGSKQSAQQFAQQVSKKLPVVDSNKNMTHTPFADLADKLETPKNETQEDISVTPDGTKLYRSHYWCPECGTNSKRYIRETSDYLKCHECNTKIIVEEAVPGEPLQQDKHGAYFIARDHFNDLDEGFFEKSPTE